MSYGISNYGARQPNTTAFIKQFIEGSAESSLWTFEPFQPPPPEPALPPVSVITPAQAMISNLYIPGNIYVGGSVIQASDVSLKSNIVELSSTNAVSRILELKPKRYKMKPLAPSPSPSRSRPDSYCYGLIAQDVEPLFPELVHCLPNGYKSVDYLSLVPILLETVRQQQDAIQELRERLHALETNQK